jgi:hypothetical protein
MPQREHFRRPTDGVLNYRPHACASLETSAVKCRHCPAAARQHLLSVSRVAKVAAAANRRTAGSRARRANPLLVNECGPALLISPHLIDRSPGRIPDGESLIANPALPTKSPAFPKFGQPNVTIWPRCWRALSLARGGEGSIDGWL